MSKHMRKGIARTGFVITLVGIVLFAIGGSALAAPPTTAGNVGHNGPTPPKLGDPVANQMEIQWVTIEVTAVNPSGTYTLTTGAGTSAAIPIATSPSAALATLYPAPAVITVVGGPVSTNYNASKQLVPSTFYWRISWGGSLAGTDIATMSANSSLTGATVTVDPYRDGQIFTGRVQPHGGYSASTDYCVQCHSVHGAADEYALLSGASVTATCQTCHSLFGSTPGAAPAGGNPFAASAPTSLRSAYEISPSPAATHGLGSQLRAGVFSTKTLTISGWSYSAGPINSTDGKTTSWSSTETEPTGPDSGLYCGDCHTPHGDFGQLVNSKFYRSSALPGTTNGGSADLSVVQKFQEDAPFYVGRDLKYLHFNAATNTWQACNETTDITCADWVLSDTEGESAYGFGYKLLSAYPNHSWSDGPESYSMDASAHDGARWCGRCHDLATPSAYGGTAHSHPTGCTACHGNPNNGTSTDFPHTSSFSTFLKDYPDLLCINCHSAGRLP